MKRKKIIITIALLFVLVEFVLGYYAQTSIYRDTYRYCIVLLAFFCNFLFFKKSWIFLFTQVALLFTIIADYFLVILDDYYLIAMMFFCVTQIAYCIRIFLETKQYKFKIIHFIIRITMSFISCIIPFIILKNKCDMLSVVVCVYYTNLIINAVFACINYKNNSFGYIFAIGLVLFVFCDFFVGIDNLSDYFEIKEGSFVYKIIFSDINFGWIFYTPSQALLGISLIGHCN